MLLIIKVVQLQSSYSCANNVAYMMAYLFFSLSGAKNKDLKLTTSELNVKLIINNKMLN